jgi:glycosyltransferase involved in cell wall biosynthesis
MKPRQIILYGPPFDQIIKRAYGGGTGGYTRNMSSYLDFEFDGISLKPLYHTVRGESKLFLFSVITRSFVDFARMIRLFVLYRPHGIHILAQYRKAIGREFAISVLANLFRTPYIYEIKAGSFIEFSDSLGFMRNYFLRFIMKNAKLVLCEGEKYIPYLQEKFDKKSHYFPNFVQSSEVPAYPNVLFKGGVIRILFVGYCVRAKGVFELVQGVSNFSDVCELPVELTLIGSEDTEFTHFMDNYPISNNLRTIRTGRMSHKEVLAHMSKNDIYCYPSRHKGEGHNNSINEAMMFGLVIITSKIGFLPEVLEDTAYFINEVGANQIYTALEQVHFDQKTAKSKAYKAHKKLLSSFTDKMVYKNLESHYKHLISNFEKK